MFDVNEFKRSVRAWVKQYRGEDPARLFAYCERIIPNEHYLAWSFLVEETVSWYENIILLQEADEAFAE